MKWQEISITATESMVDAVANIFYEIGAGGVVIEDPNTINRYIAEERWDFYDISEELLHAEYVVVKGYLPHDDNFPELMKELQERLGVLENYFDDYYGEITTSLVAEEDWANRWKEYYKPLRLGSKVIIIPYWEDYKLQENDVPVYLDPGIAFGTGSHPTTRLCVNFIEKYLQKDDVVFDVGTGSGILAITAAKLGAGKVIARDEDDLAVKAAGNNIALNKVNEKVTAERENLLDNISEKADIIIANIVADIITSISDISYYKLNPGGYFICSGIISDKEHEVEKSLINSGFEIVEKLHEQDWVAFAAKRK